ncbi:MAG: toprim domain-containing protein [Albidovulum sp.]|uniref:DUF7146 domain-containing protein n=1 Tax=Albidovulum sp. TaxID=1872424 RepID=UPI003CC107CB
MSNAESTTRLIGGGHWYGAYGTAPCPVCQTEGRDGQNALTIADGIKGLVLHCKKAGCSFQDILRALNLASGAFSPPESITSARRENDRRSAAVKRDQWAKELWNEAVPIDGTIAETYLRSRSITCDLPDSLRFHPECWHPSTKRLPALVARVDGAKAFAVHRTYLRDDGAAKAAVEPTKAMLGSVVGGAVRLSTGPGPLVVAEGIETALSLNSGLLNGPLTVWAALSTSGMKALALPGTPDDLIIATDSDDAGAGWQAGNVLAERAHALGWQVSLLPAPDGQDWNDALCAGCAD